MSVDLSSRAKTTPLMTDTHMSSYEPARNDEREDPPPPHPISLAIDRVIHQARDVKLAARQFIPLAAKDARKRFDDIRQSLKEKAELIRDPVRPVSILAQKESYETMLRFNRQLNSHIPVVLETGLFLSLFSAFDAFTSDLLRALYERKPALFGSLERQLSFAEILEAPAFESLKRQVLEDDIENLRRKSYVEQFTILGNRFGLKLTAFPRWPDFVECSQRRNLLTHCDGVVSEQYISVCHKEGVPKDRLPQVGNKVILGPAYFFNSCELVIEVGLKLGQTLWRKTLPEELEMADQHLHAALYSALENSLWKRARMIGEFAYNQPKVSSDFNLRKVTINYAQALKRDGSFSEAQVVLSSKDWSAAANDFKLGEAVLLEDYDRAAELMRRIGPKGELIDEHGYHMWPLFIEFRETEQFAAAYKDVFGHSFIAKLQEEVSEASERAAAEAQRQSIIGAEVDEAIISADSGNNDDDGTAGGG